jgi:hypothetical protein
VQGDGGDGVGGGGPEVFDAEADPVVHCFVLGKTARGGGVSDDSRGNFFKDAAGYCVSEETADIELVEASRLRNLGEGGGGVEGEGLRCCC